MTHEHEYAQNYMGDWVCACGMKDPRTHEKTRPDAAAIGQQGLDQATSAAQHEWMKTAETKWHTIARERNWATAAHLIDVIEPPPKGSLSAIGTVMKQGAKNGWWEKTDRTWVPPGKTYHNSKPLPVWLSKITTDRTQPLPAHCSTCRCR